MTVFEYHEQEPGIVVPFRSMVQSVVLHPMHRLQEEQPYSRRYLPP